MCRLRNAVSLPGDPMISRSKKRSNSLVIIIAFLVVSVSRSALPQTSRWTEGRAQAWCDRQPWLVGSNYIPQDAINQLEMWQSQSFNAAQIDKKLGWEEEIEINP